MVQWDDCGCGDCEMCNGDLPIDWTPAELKTLADLREARVVAKRQAEEQEKERLREARAAELEAERLKEEEERRALVEELIGDRVKVALEKLKQEEAARRPKILEELEITLRNSREQDKRLAEALANAGQFRDSLKAEVERLAERVAQLRSLRDDAAVALENAETAKKEAGFMADYYRNLAVFRMQSPSTSHSIREEQEEKGDDAEEVKAAAEEAERKKNELVLHDEDTGVKVLQHHVDAANEALTTNYFAVIDDFIPKQTIDRMRKELLQLPQIDALEEPSPAAAPPKAASPPKPSPSGTTKSRAKSRIPWGQDSNPLAIAGQPTGTPSPKAKDRPKPAPEPTPAPTGLHFKRGELGGGRAGSNTKYTLDQIRGDYVCWLSGGEKEVPVTCKVLDVVCTILAVLVQRMSSYLFPIAGPLCARRHVSSVARAL